MGFAFHIHPIKYWFLFPFTMSERIKIGFSKKVSLDKRTMVNGVRVVM